MGFGAINFGFGNQGNGGGGTVTGTGTDNRIVRWDGTNVPVIQDSVVELTDAGFMLPVTTNFQDLGSTAKRWKDLYLGSVIDYATNLEFKEAATSRMLLQAGGEVGIGTFALGGVTAARLHVLTGGTPLGTADLVVQNNASDGDFANISIIAGASAVAGLNFGRIGSESVGQVFYDFLANELQFGASGGTKMFLSG